MSLKCILQGNTAESSAVREELNSHVNNKNNPHGVTAEQIGVETIPSGIITMWSGSSSNIPSGWLLCNGSNGTPDLRDRFIVGAGSSYAVGATGGEATHTLTTAEMPSHNHTFTGKSHTHTLNLTGLTCSEAGEHTHTVSVPYANDAGSGNKGKVSYGSTSATLTYTTSTSGAHTHKISGTGSLGATTATGTISNTGSGTAHENRPPYYALCFIMKQ